MYHGFTLFRIHRLCPRIDIVRSRNPLSLSSISSMSVSLTEPQPYRAFRSTMVQSVPDGIFYEGCNNKGGNVHGFRIQSVSNIEMIIEAVSDAQLFQLYIQFKGF